LQGVRTHSLFVFLAVGPGRSLYFVQPRGFFSIAAFFYPFVVVSHSPFVLLSLCLSPHPIRADAAFPSVGWALPWPEKGHLISPFVEGI